MLSPATPSIDSASMGRRLPQLASGVAALAAVAVLSDDEGTVLCPFRRTTGAYCPLCGGTRATAALLRGDVDGSWDRHPLIVLLAVGGVVAALAAGVRRATRPGWPISRTANQRALAVGLALALAVWLVRLVSGDLDPPTEITWPL